jgi:hypothetical protein
VPLAAPAVRRRQRRSPPPPSSAAAGAKLYSSHHSDVVAIHRLFFHILFHIFGGRYLIAAEISAYLYIYLFDFCV